MPNRSTGKRLIDYPKGNKRDNLNLRINKILWKSKTIYELEPTNKPETGGKSVLQIVALEILWSEP
jgi:hypothetical protein